MNETNNNSTNTTDSTTNNQLICVSANLFDIFIGVTITYNLLIIVYFLYKIYKYKRRIKELVVLQEKTNGGRTNRKRIEPTEFDAANDDNNHSQEGKKNSKQKFATIELT